MYTLNKKIYIGLIEIYSGRENSVLEKGKIAFVNILAIAENEQEFNFKVKEAVNYYGLSLKSIKNVEIFEERKKNFKISDELLELAKTLNNEIDLRFGTFHTYIDNK